MPFDLSVETFPLVGGLLYSFGGFLTGESSSGWGCIVLLVEDIPLFTFEATGISEVFFGESLTMLGDAPTASSWSRTNG